MESISVKEANAESSWNKVSTATSATEGRKKWTPAWFDEPEE